MEVQEIQRRLAAFPQSGANEGDQFLIIWQDNPGIVALCWAQGGADFAAVRKALRGLPIEQAFMSPDANPEHVALRIYDPVPSDDPPPDAPRFAVGDRVKVLVHLRAGEIGTVKLVNPYGQTDPGVNEYCVGFDNPDWANRYYVEPDLEPVASEAAP